MSSTPNNVLSDEQKQYLQGFVMGADVARAVRSLPILSNSATTDTAVVRLGPSVSATGASSSLPAVARRPDALQIEAQDRAVAGGKTLAREELAKRAKDPFALADEMRANADAGVFPKDTDVFLYKYSGLFFVAPAQNSFMCRLRFPGGALTSWQFRGVADLARRYGGGTVDVTTRGNLQVREIGAAHGPAFLDGLTDLGIINRGSGADNIRNVTACATSGFDAEELIETLPLARAMHHYILNHRDMYALPRKFNIAFEGGGRVASLDDTNDIGFRAVRIAERGASEDLPTGVYFRLTLGGITGHEDFARDTGVLVAPDACVAVAAAIVRVFVREGDRSDRKKARLKYVLDSWGFEPFLQAVEAEYGKPLLRVASDRWEPAAMDERWGHVGVHAQKQPGKNYIGVVLPVGRMTGEQVDGLAMIAERFGSGRIRLTVWQNLLIPDIADADLDTARRAIEEIGLDWEASSFRAGLVACTGKAGCKYAAAHTKLHAMILASYLEERVAMDQPINIHLTGCSHSCAQHYIGDVGLRATAVEVGDEMVEGYELCVGGGWGAEQGIGRQVAEALPFDDVPATIERLLRAYLALRVETHESFAAFARRQSVDELRAHATGTAVSEFSLQTV